MSDPQYASYDMSMQSAEYESYEAYFPQYYPIIPR